MYRILLQKSILCSSMTLMKLQRTGITEAILLFDDWLKAHGHPYLPHVEGEFINWLYSSSGWYDKTIEGKYFDINVEQVKRSEVYQKWKREFFNSLLHSDYLEIMLWDKWLEAYFQGQEDLFQIFVESFMAKETHLNLESPYRHYWADPHKVMPLLKGKVLLVNPMAPLLVEQYDNAHKVYPDMPEFEPVIQRYPYCFFNAGPDMNGFETIDRIFEQIKKKDFDMALVSVGPHGCILADKINQLGKTTLTLGSGIAQLFAIDPKTDKNYWLSSIPEEYIPEGHEKIEGGRYWTKPMDWIKTEEYK